MGDSLLSTQMTLKPTSLLEPALSFQRLNKSILFAASCQYFESSQESILHTSTQIKELVDEEDNSDSTVSVRNGERPDSFPEDELLAKTDTDGSSQSHSLESIEESSKPDKIFRNPTMPQNPTNRKPFASNGCRGGTHERCIKDAEEGGCGALEQFGQEAYVKCVHHCVDHCKSPRDNLVESVLLQ